MRIVFVDVDGVVADLMTVWLSKYNNMYLDNLKAENITDWGIENFVKPECGERIFRFIEDEQIYNFVQPIPGALEKINLLKLMGFRVVYATTVVGRTPGRKFRWLRDYGFIESHKDYVELSDKSLLAGEYLVDDNIDNVRNFIGMGILYRQPWNKKYKYYTDANNWHEVLFRMNLVRYRDEKRFP